MRRIEEEELERRNKRLFVGQVVGTNAKEASLSIQTWKEIFREGMRTELRDGCGNSFHFRGERRNSCDSRIIRIRGYR